MRYINTILLARVSSRGEVKIIRHLKDLLDEGRIYTVGFEDDTMVIKTVKLPGERAYKDMLKWHRKKSELLDLQKSIVLYGDGEAA